MLRIVSTMETHERIRSVAPDYCLLLSLSSELYVVCETFFQCDLIAGPYHCADYVDMNSHSATIQLPGSVFLPQPVRKGMDENQKVQFIRSVGI